METSKLVLTAREVCAALGVSRSTFHKLRKLGVFKPLPYIRRNEIYPRQQVLDYINQAPKQGK